MSTEEAVVVAKVEGPAREVGREPAARVAWWKEWWKKAWVGTTVFWVIFGAVVIAALWGGLAVRGWTYEECKDTHFLWDMNNAFKWGTRVVRGWDGMYFTTTLDHGKTTWPEYWKNYYKLYDGVAAHPEEDPSAAGEPGYQLDYVPGKLLLMSLWMKQVLAMEPGAREFQHKYAYPMLQFNLALELLSCAGMFLLVRYWADRRGRAAVRRTWWDWWRKEVLGKNAEPALALEMATGKPSWWWSRKACVLGLAAALLLWFNPAVILEAHGWPQWDTWLIPFYVFALLLASADWMFAAGVLLAISVMFKGQVFLVAPIFLLWPVFELRLGAALRFAVGFALAFFVMVAPWLLRESASWWWVGSVIVAAGLMAGSLWLGRLGWLKRRSAWIWWTVMGTVAVAAAGLVAWPWMKSGADKLVEGRWLAAAIAGLLVAGVIIERLRGRRNALHWGAAAVTLAIVWSGLVYHGSWEWWNIGYGYGTRHYQMMTVGKSDNLAGIMAAQFGWGLQEPIGPAFDERPARRVQPRGGMGRIFGVTPPVATPAPQVVKETWGQVAKRPAFLVLYCVMAVLTGVATALLIVKKDSQWLVKMVIAWLVLGGIYAAIGWTNWDWRATTVRSALIGIYAVTLVLSALGAAIQHRRNDPRFLIAMICPWLMAFTFLAQIHERYLVWAASLAAVAVLVDIGLTLVGVLLSGLTVWMILHVMLESARDQSIAPKLLSTIRTTHPVLGYAIIFIALLFLYVALKPVRKLRRAEADKLATDEHG